jgi:hypothetical protein
MQMDDIINLYKVNQPTRDQCFRVATDIMDALPHLPGADIKKHEQYDTWLVWEYLAKSYMSIHHILNKGGFGHVMDLGAGTGIGEYVLPENSAYQFDSYDIDETRTDIWDGSNNEFFDMAVDGITKCHIKRMKPITPSYIEFIDAPTQKYDCIVAFRFPPLNLGWISVDDIKRLLQPYCVEGFTLLFCHVSISYTYKINELHKSPLLTRLYDREWDKCIYNSRDLTVFEL